MKHFLIQHSTVLKKGGSGKAARSALEDFALL
jgi:hypothetical protein